MYFVPFCSSKLVLFFKISFREIYFSDKIVYKKTDEWYIEWQRVTTNDDEWQRVVQRVTTNDTTSGNEWQRMIKGGTTSDNEWHNEWKRVTMSDTTSDNKWQQMTMSGSEWQQWHNELKRHSTLERMDDCHPFNNKNRYTTTSKHGWLQLKWLNK